MVQPPRVVGPFHQTGPSLSAAVRVRLRQSQFERTYYITEGKESQESTLSRSAGGHEGRPYLVGGHIEFRVIYGVVGAGLVPARGRPRGTPLPGWRLYRVPRDTRHCRGGACPRPRAATRAAPTWLGAYRVPHDTRRCRGGLVPARGRPQGPPLPGWRLYRVPRDTRRCRGGACPRPPV